MGKEPLIIPEVWTRYKKLNTIGAGSYGQVYLGEGNTEAGGVAGVHVVKRVHVADLPDDEMKGAINEVQLLSLLDHPNVVGYTDHFVDTEGFLNIVMEHCSQGDLNKMIELKREEKSFFRQEEVVFWAFQLMQGVKYLHSIGVIHRDLKPANIFLTANSTLKIADFGISKLVTASAVAQTVIGTPFYIAPEICENKAYTNKADVWSAGCVLYELSSLEKPFVGNNILAVVKKVTEGRYTPLHKRYHEVSAMIGQMLVVDCDKRASTAGIVDAFYTGVCASLPAPAVDGLSQADVEKTYAHWAENLKRRPSPPTRSPKSSRKAAANSKKSGSSRSERRERLDGSRSGSGQNCPDLEIHLLPSQRCLLMEDSSLAQVKFRGEGEGEGGVDGRPCERSGLRPTGSLSKLKKKEGIPQTTTGGGGGGSQAGTPAEKKKKKAKKKKSAHSSSSPTAGGKEDTSDDGGYSFDDFESDEAKDAGARAKAGIKSPRAGAKGQGECVSSDSYADEEFEQYATNHEESDASQADWGGLEEVPQVCSGVNEFEGKGRLRVRV